MFKRPFNINVKILIKIKKTELVNICTFLVLKILLMVSPEKKVVAGVRTMWNNPNTSKAVIFEVLQDEMHQPTPAKVPWRTRRTKHDDSTSSCFEPGKLGFLNSYMNLL